MKSPKRTSQIYRNYKFTWLPIVQKNSLRWKDKFNTPRCEKEPSLKIECLWFGFYTVLGDEDYWEQWLWIHKYCNGDEVAAMESWPWKDGTTKLTTWIDY